MKKENNSGTQKSVKPIPEGFHTVTPFIIVNNAAMMIEFIKEAFNAEVNYIFKTDDGKVMHALITIGDSFIMASDASERFASMPCMLHLYVDDVDSVYKQAIKAKGISLREPTNEFYGDRTAGIKDAWDNQWWIATHVEDVSDEEMKKRQEEFSKQETHS